MKGYESLFEAKESKLDKKVEELKNEGYTFVGYQQQLYGGRNYTIAVLEKDGKRVIVNHRGGTDTGKGLVAWRHSLDK